MQSNENRTPVIKHIPRKSWQHCCYATILPSVGYKNREVWFASLWLRVLRRTIKSKRPGFCRTESSFCMITPIPILPIRWGISFRELAGKHFNILRTAKIFPLVTSTFLATWRKTFVDVGFIRTRNARMGEVVDPSSTYLFLQDWNWSSVSQWDKCINTSGNYFWI